MEENIANKSVLEIFRMLDENFKDQMEEIIRLSPRGRQTMLFSATMTDEVTNISMARIRRNNTLIWQMDGFMNALHFHCPV